MRINCRNFISTALAGGLAAALPLPSGGSEAQGAGSGAPQFSVIQRRIAMTRTCHTRQVLLPLILLFCSCQINQRGTEIRTDEQMLDVSFENAGAEEVFDSIIRDTERETNVKARIGSPSFSLYSRYETVAFNAHCNDHIRAMDKNADLLISQKEAEEYYKYLAEEGKIVHKK
jgi:hypothetical protein